MMSDEYNIVNHGAKCSNNNRKIAIAFTKKKKYEPVICKKSKQYFGRKLRSTLQKKKKTSSLGNYGKKLGKGNTLQNNSDCMQTACWHRLSTRNKRKSKIKNKMKNINKAIEKAKAEAAIKKIKIDDTDFELINYNPTAYNNRGLVQIRSTKTDGKSFTFFVYRSHSELGFWRFAFHDEGQLWKGDHNINIAPDYIQITFIDLRLQEFINKSLNQLVITNDTHCTLEKYNSINNFEGGELDEILDEVDNRNRNEFNLTFHSQDDVKKYSRCGYKPTKDNIFNSAKILEDNYNIGTKQTVNNNYIFKVNVGMGNTIDILDVKSTIYSVKLNRKTDDEKLPTLLRLYYMNIKELKIKSFTKGPKSFKYYKIPVFLEIFDEGSKILNTGLYSKFFTLGSYICKTLDYSKQCSINNSKECTKYYSFVGDLYKNNKNNSGKGPVFPFNKI
jgi:hypothetical protein